MPSVPTFELATRFADDTLKMVGQRFVVDTTKLNTNTQYHVRNYGAVCDGTTDDTGAVLDALADAKLTGGVVVFPEGKIRIRSTLTIENPLAGDGTLKPVSLRGSGMATTTIVWDPIDVADDCIVAHTEDGPYKAVWTGEVSDLQIVNVNHTCSGCGIRIDNAFRFVLRNVLVGLFQGGAGFDGVLTNRGGTGIKVHSSNLALGIDAVNQHVHFDHVVSSNNYTSFDIEAAYATSAIKCCIDGGPAYIRDGVHMDWHFGDYQGGTMFVFVPTVANGIEFTLHGGWCETNENGVWPVTFKGLAPTDGSAGIAGAGGVVRIVDLHLSANTPHVFDFDSYQLYIKRPKALADPHALKLRSCAGVYEGFGISQWLNVPAGYDLDTYSRNNATWIDPGMAAIGTPTPGAAGAGRSVALGGMLGLAGFTQAERNALTYNAENDVVYNKTIKRAQVYDGTRWRSAKDARVKELISSAALKAYFETDRGINSGSWASQASNHVLTANNSPVLGADGKRFGGRPAWKFVKASSQYLDSGNASPVIWAAGASTFYAFMVMRLSALTDPTMSPLIVSDNNPTAAAPWRVYYDVSGGPLSANINQSGSEIATAIVDTNEHLVEVYAPGNGSMVIAIDGVEGVAGPASPLALVSERIYVGGTPLYAAECTLSLVALGFANAPPSGDIRAALLELYQDKYEF